ncbi:uncharacterized protein PFLUO_LOCUS4618 [Penicillium psychrofluorescens]|uniref:uncharacterized protein n=1 Tax=Penicillium psychrofluorescens TaxID=3158075 RepID=UPI003CCDD55A
MADEEAEQAFFQAQATDDDAGEPGADNGNSDDYDPSQTLQDQLPPATESDAQPDDDAPSMTISADSNAAPQPGDTLNPSQTPSRAESQTSTPIPPSGEPAEPKTRMIGGFVVEDGDDDEDDKGDAEYEPPGVLGAEDTNAMPSMSEEPSSGNANQTTSAPDVSSVAPASAHEIVNSSPHFSVPVPSSNPDPAAPVAAQWAPPQDSLTPSLQNSTVPTPVPDSPSAARARLPHDRVGILQDRIDEDPRGDIAAWLELIAEHRSRNRLDSAREVYERFLKVFPMAADQWVAYANMESEVNELFRLEQIFNRALLTIPNIQLWNVYLDYVRRRNPLTTDTSRTVISSAYDLALTYIGMDKDSGNVWSDYVEFIRSGPGTVGGSGWQDQQKMDLLRKAYQKAIGVPTQAVNTLWKEYDQFEMGLNKLTGRKFLQEQSPSYMTARSSYTELQNITRDLVRTSLPRLPPVPGSEGDVEFSQQVDIWKRWIAWEKGDPLVIKDEDLSAFKNRVVYVYKQALMALRFLPEIWFEAAEFCYANDMENEGTDFLKQGIEANPESCLLCFKLGDRLEVTSDSEQDSTKRAAKVREPYDKLLEALYELITKARTQESQDVARIEEWFAKQNPEKQSTMNEDDDDAPPEEKEKESAKKAQVDAIRNAHSIQINILSKTISFAWIALMRAIRRIQGKGKPGELAGSRQIFAEARKRGRITSDVYIASALMEYHCYKDPAATKIFERGAKLFPEDEHFALEYLKHLIDINDIINARAVFETTVRKLASNPANAHKAKPIFSFLHEYESRYGDLVQVINLENRMRELYPEDPNLSQFTRRYSSPNFDPTAVRPILSPSQTRPKTSLPGVTAEPPTTGYLDPSMSSSPKRPFPSDDFDDSNRPRKFVRAESPLKGTTGRRAEQPMRGQPPNGQTTTSAYMPQGSQTPLPRDVVHLLSIIPAASTYTISRLSPEKMIDLLRRIDIPSSTSQIPLPQSARGLGGGQSSGYSGSYR